VQPKSNERARSKRSVVLALAAAFALVSAGLGVFFYQAAARHAEAAASRLRLEDIPFNGARAYEYLKQICALGPRPSGSKGMEAQQKLLEEHFGKLGGKVHLQRFKARHPVEGSLVSMANLVVQWHPESKDRVLLCAHYDTLPFPMLDPHEPRGVFVGANDGASGVAVLMELAHEIPTLPARYGVDFVLFDGEEFVFRTSDEYFLGSEFFAQSYVKKRPAHRYRAAVLLDMVGDADLQLYQERNSMAWSDTRPLVEEIWATARRLGVREFIAKRKYEVRDDHLALHNVAGIPACDVIDFDYPAWHTRADTPERCSALSLAKVGWVLREWLAASGPRQGTGSAKGGN
jgi:hypothetical protein